MPPATASKAASANGSVPPGSVCTACTQSKITGNSGDIVGVNMVADKAPLETLEHAGQAPGANPAIKQIAIIRLIGRNETMRRIEGEEIAGHISRNPLVRTSGAHFAGETGLVRDFTQYAGKASEIAAREMKPVDAVFDEFCHAGDIRHNNRRMRRQGLQKNERTVLVPSGRNCEVVQRAESLRQFGPWQNTQKFDLLSLRLRRNLA
jgi:hypothetical protein